MQRLYSIICPHCRKPGKVPIELEGKSIRCKGCKKTFSIKVPNPGVNDSSTPIQRPAFSKRRLWGIICLVLAFLVIVFDLLWCFFLEPYFWKPMDDFLEVPSVSLGLRLWEVVISLFVILPLAIIGFILLILNPRSPKVKKR
jgi:hypothetical protein